VPAHQTRLEVLGRVAVRNSFTAPSGSIPPEIPGSLFGPKETYCSKDRCKSTQAEVVETRPPVGEARFLHAA
jgi:hypothetical protein